MSAHPTPAPAVIVVGSYMQDLTWRCAAFPRPGETTIGRSFALGPGGKGSNQAIACGRAGVPTLFVGAVGGDAFADVARSFYASNRITAHFITKPRHATGSASILVDDSGQNQIVVALGANAALAPRDLPPDLFRGARVVVTQLETGLPVVTRALRSARRAGALTVLNPAPMRPDFDPALLREADVLIPNETEFVALINQLGLAPRPPGAKSRAPAYTETALAAETPAALHALCRRLGPSTVIVTLGRRGCYVSLASPAPGSAASDTPYTLIPAHRVTAVDTTGAGDAFVGGFAAGLILHHGDVLAAARHGQAVAALSVTRPGTAPAMPTAREISAFLRKSTHR